MHLQFFRGNFEKTGSFRDLSLTDSGPRYLTTKQAAEVLELPEDYVYRLRRIPGKGPRYFKHGGKVRYERGDLMNWLVANSFV